MTPFLSDPSLVDKANKPALRFQKSQRILSGQSFRQILRSGYCRADQLLVLFAAESDPTGPTRLGITIPKKTGNAVMRNRWKRLIREAFREQQHLVPQGYDFVVRPKKGATADPKAIRESLLSLAKRIAKDNKTN